LFDLGKLDDSSCGFKCIVWSGWSSYIHYGK